MNDKFPLILSKFDFCDYLSSVLSCIWLCQGYFRATEFTIFSILQSIRFQFDEKVTFRALVVSYHHTATYELTYGDYNPPKLIYIITSNIFWHRNGFKQTSKYGFHQILWDHSFKVICRNATHSIQILKEFQAIGRKARYALDPSVKF